MKMSLKEKKVTVETLYSKLSLAQKLALKTKDFSNLSAAEMCELSDFLLALSSINLGNAKETGETKEKKPETDLDILCRKNNIQLNDYNENVIKKYLESGTCDYNSLSSLAINIKSKESSSLAEKMFEAPDRFSLQDSCLLLQKVAENKSLIDLALGLIDKKNKDEVFMFNPESISNILLKASLAKSIDLENLLLQE